MSFLPVLLLLIAVLLLALSWGRRRWRLRTDRLLARLLQPRPTGAPVSSAAATLASTRFAAADLATLPLPVRRYLLAVLRDGQPRIVSATIAHSGRFRLREADAAGRRFISTEAVRAEPPAFVWDARVALAPGLRIHVHDAYVGGEGILHAAVAGLYTVARVGGAPEAARGQLARFAAEAPWYPTVLLPGPLVQWDAIDDRHARLTLRDAVTTAQLTFGFGDDDLVSTVRVEDRPRLVAGTLVPTPWEGRFWNYAERDGMRVPLDGEVAWIPESGRLPPYWRGHLERVGYLFHA